MKKMKKFSLLAAVIAFGLLTSCSKDQGTDVAQEENLSTKQQMIKEMSTQQSATRAPISYAGVICGDDINGSTSLNSYDNVAAAAFYSFDGTAGDVVSLNVTRTSPGLDPGMALFFGTTTDSNGIDVFGNGGPDMTYLGDWDDNVADPFGSCFSDPAVSGLILPSTGTYTLIVYDVLGCGAPYNFVVQSSGISCDADGDGCLDNVDPTPNSNTDATVNWNGCDSGVANVFIDCNSLNDLIAECAANSGSSGAFRTCVSNMTNDWVSAGIISRRDRLMIIRCAR